MMFPLFTVRLGTQDLQVANEVMRQNEYRLTQEFAGDDVIIDVGAHIGAFTLSCLGRGAGRVVCLEPDPDNFALLQRNLFLFKDRVQLLNVALWPEGVSAPFLQKKSVAHTAMTHCLAPCGEPVETISLDALLLNYPKVRLLKLDCEGAEWPALYESCLLARCQEIVGELHHGMKLATWPDAWGQELLKPRLAAVGFETEIAAGTMPELTSNFFARRAA